jgi:hypothetical protein
MCMCYGAIIARNSSVYVAHIKFWFMNNLHASVKPSLPGPSGMTVSTWEVCSVWEWHGFYTTPHSWESPQQSTHSNEQFTSLVLVFCFLLIFWQLEENGIFRLFGSQSKKISQQHTQLSYVDKHWQRGVFSCEAMLAQFHLYHSENQLIWDQDNHWLYTGLLETLDAILNLQLMPIHTLTPFLTLLLPLALTLFP